MTHAMKAAAATALALGLLLTADSAAQAETRHDPATASVSQATTATSGAHITAQERRSTHSTNGRSGGRNPHPPHQGPGCTKCQG